MRIVRLGLSKCVECQFTNFDQLSTNLSCKDILLFCFHYLSVDINIPRLQFYIDIASIFFKPQINIHVY